MNCKQFYSSIHDYIDAEISGNYRKELEAHLENCCDCRQLLNDLHNNVSVPLSLLDFKEPSPYIWNKIKSNIEYKTTVSFRLRYVFSLALMIVIIASWMFLLPVKDNNKEDYADNFYNEFDFAYETEVSFGTSIEEFFL